MLTPAFELSQDGDFIIVYIKAPFAKVSETEVYIEGFEFKFYSKPYYLRLTLPGEVIEDGRESAKYDTDKGSFTVRVPKVNKGEHFDGLDMLTKLLAPAGQTSAKAPLIEVIGDVKEESGRSEPAEGEGGGVGEEGEEEEEEEEIDWHVEQVPYTEDVSLGEYKYGFGNTRSGVFKRLQAELHDVIDLKEADSLPPSERQKQRQADEDAHFDEDYYLADLYNDENIEPALAYRPPWIDEYNKVKEGKSPEDVVELTEEMKEKMLKLPRKEYLLDKSSQKEALIGLVDLIFSYCYNHRTTEGENNVESSWNIAKLSSTLSWLQTPCSMRECVVTCMRRSLCYPLYRHWKLSKKVLKDTQRIFIIGRRRLLKCLLEIHSLLIDTESRYILNDLYVTDYCVWVQTLSHKTLKSLAKSLTEVSVDKDDVGFDLVALETAAALVYEGEEEEEDEELSTRAERGSNVDLSDVVSEIGSLSLETNPPINNSSNARGQQTDKDCESLKPVTDNSKCLQDSEAGGSSSSADSDSETSSGDSSSEDSDDLAPSSGSPKQEGATVISGTASHSGSNENESKKILIEDITETSYQQT